LRFERAGDAQNTARWRVKPLGKGQSGALGQVIPKAPANKPGTLLVIPKKKNGLAPLNGAGDHADPDYHPDSGTVAVNGAASNGSAPGQAVGSAALHAAAEDGAPGLSEQEIADLKDQL
jgi:hypothetical protein